MSELNKSNYLHLSDSLPIFIRGTIPLLTGCLLCVISVIALNFYFLTRIEWVIPIFFNSL